MYELHKIYTHLFNILSIFEHLYLIQTFCLLKTVYFDVYLFSAKNASFAEFC